MLPLVDIRSVRMKDKPFSCFTIENAVSELIEQRLLAWFEQSAPWKLRVADFYEQYEFSFDDLVLPADIQPVFSSSSVQQIRHEMEKHFRTKLRANVEITAHQLTNNQTIRVHNDFRSNGETHRFLIQLNRGWEEQNGGYLMLFRGDSVESVDCIIPPYSRSGFGFEISHSSHHAVSKVHSGNRYTIVFSFYEDGRHQQ